MKVKLKCNYKKNKFGDIVDLKADELKEVAGLYAEVKPEPKGK